MNSPSAASASPEVRAIRRGRRWRRCCLVLLVPLVLAAAMHWHVVLSGGGWIVSAAAAPRVDAIVVPGARIHPDGTPYHLLGDRLQAALELWRGGAAPQIVLSGLGGGGVEVDEVLAMRRWLAARGVPAAAMRDDGEGLRTLDTMRRCRALGFRSLLVVSNDFHLPRAVFLARHCGLDAHGVVAAAQVDYSLGTRVKNRGREVLARVWAWFEVFVLDAAD